MANIQNQDGNSMPINWKEVPVTVADLNVGLSNCPNLTARIKITKYINGEGKIKIEHLHQEQTQSKPPKREGELVNENGLNPKAKSKIKMVCRCLQFLVLKHKEYRGYCSFITLTYGKNYPDDKTSKKHLDIFLKRMRRHLNNFHYVWVAEKQRRGAIHYHIVTPNFVKKELINLMWNQVANKWLKEKAFNSQVLMPNIKAVNNISGYMAKYISKEGQTIIGKMYGMSKLTQELIKPIEENYFDFPTEIISEIVKDVYNVNRPKNFGFISDDFNGNPRVWTTNIEPIITRVKNIHDSI